MTTVYQCGSCGGIVTSVWNHNGRNLCRVCFGRDRLGDMGSGGVQHESTLYLVRSDGTRMEIDTITGREVNGNGSGASLSARPVRKIRLVVEKVK